MARVSLTSTLYEDIHAAPIAVSAPVTGRTGQPAAVQTAFIAIDVDPFSGRIDDLSHSPFHVFATSRERDAYIAAATADYRDVYAIDWHVGDYEAS